jgi:tRNA 5-methylaminomethyl-2-thiouridine biosynthesis bifunctional protein
VVLANAADAVRLLDMPDWPMQSVRGQLSWLEAAPRLGRPLPRVPISGAGYLLDMGAGRAVFGATSDAGDTDGQLRAADHARNAAQLAALSPGWAGVDPAGLQGRVGWRCTASDRLPLIGAVPQAGCAGGRLDQPRFVARHDGLYVFTGLGSRGIASAPLGAAVLAAWMTGSPLPVEASLRDALDPARFAVRRWRAAQRCR